MVKIGDLWEVEDPTRKGLILLPIPPAQPGWNILGYWSLKASLRAAGGATAKPSSMGCQLPRAWGMREGGLKMHPLTSLTHHSSIDWSGLWRWWSPHLSECIFTLPPSLPAEWLRSDGAQTFCQDQKHLSETRSKHPNMLRSILGIRLFGIGLHPYL